MRGREHTPSGVQKANKENKKLPLKQYVPELLDLWGSLNNDVDDKRRLDMVKLWGRYLPTVKKISTY